VMRHNGCLESIDTGTYSIEGNASSGYTVIF